MTAITGPQAHPSRPKTGDEPSGVERGPVVGLVLSGAGRSCLDRRPARRRRAAALVAAGLLMVAAGACTQRQQPTGPPPGGAGGGAGGGAPARPAPNPGGGGAPAPASGWQAEMLASVNAERAKAGLAPMTLCGTLNKAAQGYAELMASTRTFAHRGPDGSMPADRQRAAGYVAAPGQRYLHGAENIAMGYPDVAAVMAGWMSSSGHRANIMASATTHLGVGRQGAYWVQNFGVGGTC